MLSATSFPHPTSGRLHFGGQKTLKVGFATANQNKLREAATIADTYSRQTGQPVEIVPLPPSGDVEETGSTLEENARIKLNAALEEGFPDDITHVVAEDTGFEVDALRELTGKPFPGVHANRWLNNPALQERLLGGQVDAPTNEDRNQGIRAALAGRSDRDARYKTCLALWDRATDSIREIAGKMELVVIGEEEAPRGEHGFAYDTIVKPAGQADKTVAELKPEEKDALSHRGEALRKLFSLITS